MPGQKKPVRAIRAPVFTMAGLCAYTAYQSRQAQEDLDPATAPKRDRKPSWLKAAALSFCAKLASQEPRVKSLLKK
jgi:Tfp pilus assembly protein PilF